jgi:hypothetical protein
MAIGSILHPVAARRLSGGTGTASARLVTVSVRQSLEMADGKWQMSPLITIDNVLPLSRETRRWVNIRLAVCCILTEDVIVSILPTVCIFTKLVLTSGLFIVLCFSMLLWLWLPLLLHLRAWARLTSSVMI